eukprot:gene18106-23760_t
MSDESMTIDELSTSNDLIDELWRIYTYYSLHFHPTNLEVWRSTTFIRFARDTQIIASTNSHISSIDINSTHSQLSVPVVELEIARLAKNKDRFEIEKDYSPTSVAIRFDDFLDLINDLSTKLYKHNTVEAAARRILLENVLLLANRRVPLNRSFDCKQQEAVRVIRQFQRALSHIFRYYLTRAESRRNTLVAKQLTLVSSLTSIVTDISPAVYKEEQNKLKQLKRTVKRQKELIGYKEFTQFGQDFAVTSSSLLTSIQFGDIYLQVVPLDERIGCTLGMSFDQFIDALVYCAYVSYHSNSKESQLSISSMMKAFLLYLWKAINNEDRNAQLVKQYIHSSTNDITSSGVHDMFGSGLFSESFLVYWQKDNFHEYSKNDEEVRQINGAKVLHRITAQSQISRDRVASALSDSSDDVKSSQPSTVHPANSSTVVEMRSSQLAALFSLRPEIAEFVYLEINNMKKTMV